jgi:glycosyltransferase 2 family protein
VRTAMNLTLSLAMLGLCVWLLWPDHDAREHLRAVVGSLRLADIGPYLAGYLGLLVLIHLCRAWRWHNLLAPLGVRVPPGRLLAISFVGFMAILAFPARLGELVRPALIRRKGELSASAALGTVAVERIVDGLLISLFVFGAFFANRGPDQPWWMMATAYGALALFAAASLFLLFALRRPEATVRLALRASLVERFAPRLARLLEGKLLEMIRGFGVLHDPRNLAAFLGWTLLYWTANGLSLWLLARGFHLPLGLVGAYATMGLVGVGIMLPNAPGLFGQYQWFTMLGLSLYLGPAVLDEQTPLYAVSFAFAMALHGLQVLFFLAMGGLGMASSHVSLRELWRSRKLDPEDGAGDSRA